MSRTIQAKPTEFKMFKVVRDLLHIYIVSDEEPKNGDKVFTESYGVWTFRNDGTKIVPTAPPAFWANSKACRKLIATSDDSFHESVCKIPESFVKLIRQNYYSVNLVALEIGKVFMNKDSGRIFNPFDLGKNLSNCEFVDCVKTINNEVIIVDVELS